MGICDTEVSESIYSAYEYGGKLKLHEIKFVFGY